MLSVSFGPSVVSPHPSAIAPQRIPTITRLRIPHGKIATRETPRVTHDVDVVIAPVLGTLNALLRQFPSDKYYVDRDAALQADGTESMFNVVDFATGWKVDFIIRKSHPLVFASMGVSLSRSLKVWLVIGAPRS